MAYTDVRTIGLDALLDFARPRRAPSLIGPLFLFALVAAVLVTIPLDSRWVAALIPLAFAGMIVFSLVHASRLAAKQRMENDLLREADEQLRLLNWDLAADRLSRLVGAPSSRQHVQYQTLIYTGALLNKEGRFADVIRLYEFLLEHAAFPPQIAVSLKCMRLYAMLRDDRLSDAYEAIGQLKRDYPDGGAILSLLDMYRLVRTGHHEDALALFELKRQQFAEGLSHRSADAWALAAVSATQLGKSYDAGLYARRACLLSDAAQISHRFPECATVLRFDAGGAKS